MPQSSPADLKVGDRILIEDPQWRGAMVNPPQPPLERTVSAIEKTEGPNSMWKVRFVEGSFELFADFERVWVVE